MITLRGLRLSLQAIVMLNIWLRLHPSQIQNSYLRLSLIPSRRNSCTPSNPSRLQCPQEQYLQTIVTLSCSLQIRKHLGETGRQLPVLHPVQVLEQSYRGA